MDRQERRELLQEAIAEAREDTELVEELSIHEARTDWMRYRCWLKAGFSEEQALYLLGKEIVARNQGPLE